MSSVCVYFQVHQPFRLKHYRYHNVGHDYDYFNDELNASILKRVSHKCYVPTNKLLLELIKQHKGAFKIAFSISGTAVEQMEQFAPEALELFQELAVTGCVEFLSETYYHSLAALYDEEEFTDQVRLHQRMIKKYFGQSPKVFRNTELIYNDHIGQLASKLGYKGILADGVDDILEWRNPCSLYSIPETNSKLILKNGRLSDDIAFRFSCEGWQGYPLTAPKFASWIHSVGSQDNVVGLFLDYETFGEHQWATTGIFDFLRYLPQEILKDSQFHFATPSEVLEKNGAASELSFSRTTSWADIEKNTDAWCGNRMQRSSLKQIYDLKAARGTEYEETWRKLQTSDLFYYMSTKSSADGEVHSYFSHFESPYDAFIAYMNVLRDFKGRVGVDLPELDGELSAKAVGL